MSLGFRMKGSKFSSNPITSCSGVLSPGIGIVTFSVTVIFEVFPVDIKGKRFI